MMLIQQQQQQQHEEVPKCTYTESPEKAVK